MNTALQKVKQTLKYIRNDKAMNLIARNGNTLYVNGQVTVLAQGADLMEFEVDDQFEDFRVSVSFSPDVVAQCSCKVAGPCGHRIAAFLQAAELLNHNDFDNRPEGKQYTREGMIKRVLEERKERAEKAKYRIAFADNCHGVHELVNEKGKRYFLTLRDFEKKVGHCSCKDYQTNKLGTCKHLLFAFDQLPKTLSNQIGYQAYPFFDVYLDPLNDYRISYFFPNELPHSIKPLVERYFKDKTYVESDGFVDFLEFVKEAEPYKFIFIRPQVLDKLEEFFDDNLVVQIADSITFDYTKIKAELYPYQKEGVAFATAKRGAIIADEMGLGKTLQAISTAVFKKEHFDFEKTLVVCPASLKSQWKSEIEKFTDEKAIVVEGLPVDREQIYQQNDAYFVIVNYEMVLRDVNAINKAGFDFVILDEAQRIKNYETITSEAIKRIKKKHALVITGTPIENKLIDLFSIVEFVRPNFLAPLWEFSQQHCYFDQKIKNKITGYYNLQALKERLRPLLIRREKRDVIEQLNKVTHIDVPVNMSDLQREYHASAAHNVARILSKRYRTPYDMQMLTKHLQTMRMACDSSYLVDLETNESPKLLELQEILLEKLDLSNNQRKVIIFSEWKRMNRIIGKMLMQNGIGFTELNGSVPVAKRKKLIAEFEENSNCRIFLSTEAGGAGLNLQVADTVINFELPWNPAKKNQRIGRIDRLGQKNEHLTVINLITRDSIEMKIASGLLVKQNLFDSVLSPDNMEDVVDFSGKGKAQFLKELEAALEEFTAPAAVSKTDEEDETLRQLELPEVQRPENSGDTHSQDPTRKARIRQMEEVMQSGMQFLAGMYRMSTGNDLDVSQQKIEIDEATGEVVMRFKI